MDIVRISQCKDHPNSKIPSPLYARYQRYNRTQKVLNANYTLARDLDEKFVVITYLIITCLIGLFFKIVCIFQQTDVSLQKWGDGGWKNQLNFKLTDTCRQFLKYMRRFWTDFLKHFEVDDPESCPLKKVK